MMHQPAVPMMVSLVVFCTTLVYLPGCVCSWSRASRHVIPPSTVPGPTLPPVFDPLVPTNVTVTASKTVLLSCIVHNLGNNSVSWIRHRDLHILSVGSVTYTSDSRFEAVPHAGKGDWLLRLQYAHPRDSGQYDCQVSSAPPTARTTHLTVIEPQAKILGAPDIHVGMGSPINLTCVVPYSPEPPDYLHWYHKERMVREDGVRVWLKTNLGHRSVSQLVVMNAAPRDSGVYTCNPAHSLEHSITVHVLTAGEYPAAMQGGSSVTCAGRRVWALLVTAVLITTVTTSLLLPSALPLVFPDSPVYLTRSRHKLDTAPLTRSRHKLDTAPLTRSRHKLNTAPLTRSRHKLNTAPLTRSRHKLDTAPLTRSRHKLDTAPLTRSRHKLNTAPLTRSRHKLDTAPLTRSRHKLDTAPLTRSRHKLDTAPLTRSHRKHNNSC
ncbi:uncharacterized protein LOC121859054 [Homarus americanus]|uniref:uncharacterized protein LOC121859054 n=1 Tax=Homarus americanus TaxID=6706 RepID=UPI001C48C336|nr:uncharacterized protein LOC121859054 [Homarus americanus]